MNETKSKLLKEMNSVETENALKNKVPLFLPLGTLEAHGRHLPVSTDTICAQGVAEALASKTGGVVAPPVEYGLTNVLLQTSPGSFFDVDLYKKFIESIIRNFRRQGFTTIIVVNGHGGNRDALKPIIRNITREEPLALAVINWWMYSERYTEQVYGCIPGGHAAAEETAAILYFAPQLVNKNNYVPDIDDHVPDDSFWMYPPPGEVLLNKYGQGQPNFSKEKAEQFMTLTIEALSKELKRWMNSFGRIKGGLRPSAAK